MRDGITVWIVLVLVGVFVLQFWTATSILRFDSELLRGMRGWQMWLTLGLIILGLLAGLVLSFRSNRPPG